MAWTTPRTWVDGETATAALFNTHIRDNLNAIAVAGIAGWTDYSGSATMTASGSNPTYTVNYAKYAQVGKTVRYRAKFTLTTAGTGTYAWSLPVTAVTNANALACGAGSVYDNDLTDLVRVEFDSGGATTTLRGLWDQQTAAGVVTQTSPFTFAASDIVTFAVAYEAA